MQQYQQRVQELYADLDDIDANRLSIRAEIGKTLYRKHPAVLEQEAFSDLLPQISAQNEEIARIAATIERLEEIGERVKALGLDREEKEKRKEELTEELRPHYRAIGAAAFRIFRENPLIDSKYTEIFKPLSENYDEVRQLERELANLHGEEAKRPLVARLMKRGQDLLLKNRIQNKQEKRDALHEEAGRQLCRTEFIALLDDPDLNAAAEPYEELMERINGLQKEIDEIDEEIRELNQEQQEKSGGKRLQKAVADLRETRAQRESAQHALFAQVGGRYVDTLAEKEPPEELGFFLDELTELDEREAEKRKGIEKLDAAVKVAELGNRIRQTDEEKERQQRKLERIQRSIDELQKELTHLQEEQQRAAELRGPEEDLPSI